MEENAWEGPVDIDWHLPPVRRCQARPAGALRLPARGRLFSSVGRDAGDAADPAPDAPGRRTGDRGHGGRTGPARRELQARWKRRRAAASSGRTRTRSGSAGGVALREAELDGEPAITPGPFARPRALTMAPVTASGRSMIRRRTAAASTGIRLAAVATSRRARRRRPCSPNGTRRSFLGRAVAEHRGRDAQGEAHPGHPGAGRQFGVLDAAVGTGHEHRRTRRPPAAR